MRSTDYGELAMSAAALDDVEGARKAAENRLRILTATELDKDGEMRGFSLPPDAPAVMAQFAALTQLVKTENELRLALCRAVRRHPLGPWIKATVGVGEKQGARLLAAIGDPYWNTLHDRPRTVSELWAYCGYHVIHPGTHVSRARVEQSSDGGTITDTAPSASSPAVGAVPPTGHGFIATHGSSAGGGSSSAGGGAHDNGDTQIMGGVAPRRIRGQRANWSSTAKSRAHLVAVSCMKQTRSPYRHVYDLARKKHADAVHNHPCAQCGPKGRPAPVGSPLNPGHQNFRALREVAKEVLKDLWRTSRDLHLGEAAE